MHTIAEFAKASEELNAFARSLRERGIDATTGADIRMYQGGPRLEKWVEARQRNSESVFCWWLEIGSVEGDAAISAHVNESNGDTYRELDGRRASEIREVQNALSDAVAWLKTQDMA
jgi:hypothetical protein